jgi:hypothetical protein
MGCPIHLTVLAVVTLVLKTSPEIKGTGELLLVDIHVVSDKLVRVKT